MENLEDEIMHLCEYYDFIKKELCFYTFKDFVNNAEYIKSTFETSTKYEKQLYKLYVYANSHLFFSCKNLIWDYLNCYKNLANLLFFLYNFVEI